MPRATLNKIYRTFVKGLITEAGYLTYPENSSVDELNTIISRKGNRTRRLGIDYEDGFSFSNLGLADTLAVNEFVWKAVNNDSSVNFLCVQVGSMVSFYDLSNNPISDSKKSFTVDLSSKVIASKTTNDVKLQQCQFAAGAGYLFIVHPLVEPLLVEYLPTTNSLNTVAVVVQIRDLVGVYDTLANDQEPTTLSKEHYYNLLNQGWGPPGSTPVTSGTSAVTTGTYYDPYTGGTKGYNLGNAKGGLVFQ